MQGCSAGTTRYHALQLLFHSCQQIATPPSLLSLEQWFPHLLELDFLILLSSLIQLQLPPHGDSWTLHRLLLTAPCSFTAFSYLPQSPADRLWEEFSSPRKASRSTSLFVIQSGKNWVKLWFPIHIRELVWMWFRTGHQLPYLHLAPPLTYLGFKTETARWYSFVLSKQRRLAIPIFLLKLTPGDASATLH